MISPYGVFTSYQVNVDAQRQQHLGDAANEPSIAVDPTDGNRMTIGWRQFNSVQSDFRQCGYGYTTDGGITGRFPASWKITFSAATRYWTPTRQGAFSISAFSNRFSDNIWGSTQRRPILEDLDRATAEATSNGSRSITPTAPVMDSNIRFGARPQQLTARQFSRSTDGGVTWMDPISIPNSPVWGTLDVDSNGNLFIGGEAIRPVLVRSLHRREERGSQTPTFDQSHHVNLGGRSGFGS